MKNPLRHERRQILWPRETYRAWSAIAPRARRDASLGFGRSAPWPEGPPPPNLLQAEGRDQGKGRSMSYVRDMLII
eukprot:scaffold161374_cov27-Tisochrysis_lutea.AAC.1